MDNFGWMPLVPLEEGLIKTVEYFRDELKKSKTSNKKDSPDL